VHSLEEIINKLKIYINCLENSGFKRGKQSIFSENEKGNQRGKPSSYEALVRGI